VEILAELCGCYRNGGLQFAFPEIEPATPARLVSFGSCAALALYELERYDANAHRWRALLARPNPQS
jgi:hypothetical protein